MKQVSPACTTERLLSLQEMHIGYCYKKKKKWRPLIFPSCFGFFLQTHCLNLVTGKSAIAVELRSIYRVLPVRNLLPSFPLGVMFLFWAISSWPNYFPLVLSYSWMALFLVSFVCKDTITSLWPGQVHLWPDGDRRVAGKEAASLPSENTYT